ncbi:hypothetical protein IWX91DRAFT_147457 [Phyllosticta citricarpa]
MLPPVGCNSTLSCNQRFRPSPLLPDCRMSRCRLSKSHSTRPTSAYCHCHYCVQPHPGFAHNCFGSLLVRRTSVRFRRLVASATMKPNKTKKTSPPCHHEDLPRQPPRRDLAAVEPSNQPCRPQLPHASGLTSPFLCHFLRPSTSLADAEAIAASLITFDAASLQTWRRLHGLFAPSLTDGKPRQKNPSQNPTLLWLDRSRHEAA